MKCTAPAIYCLMLSLFSYLLYTLISLLSTLVPTHLSSFTSCAHSSLFSHWRHNVSSNFFDTQVPSVLFGELVLPRHARCILSRLCCNGHNLRLNSYLSRIKDPLCRDWAPVALWRIFLSIRDAVHGLGSRLAFSETP